MTDSIFHEGDLNSGISLAISSKKLVACFVYQPDNHESQIWEDYWLANRSQPTDIISSDAPPLGLMLAEKAVLLKIELGSQESGFLTAFCPIAKAPAMVIIHNGKVLEKLESGVGREEFTGRLLKAVGFDASAKGRMPEVFVEDDGDNSREVDETGNGNIFNEPEVQSTVLFDAESSANVPTSSSEAESPDEGQNTPSEVQEMLSERARRLEAERLRREAAEKAERIARRRKEAEEAAAAQGKQDRERGTIEHKSKQQARDAWIYQQKQRKDEAKKERERILAQIESDKQERKAEAVRQTEREQLAGGGAYSEIPTTSSATSTNQSNSHHKSCALQVRLFDGSSIRSTFAPDADITTAVRTWVEEASPAGGADIPYNFRQILAPQPSRTIEVSEEQQSLLELGLVPSATLVLVPIAGATSAYASAESGYVMGTVNWVAGAVYNVLGTAWSFVPGFGAGGSGTSGPYMSGTGDEQEGSNAEGARMAGSDSAAPGGAAGAKMRVKTLADQKKEDKLEFYNGNSSAFEGRKDDEEGDVK